MPPHELAERAATEEGVEPRSDRLLFLAVVCAVIAWALAAIRFFLALMRHEHGVDSALAAILSVALPCIVASALLHGHQLSRRRIRSSTGNVVPLRPRAATQTSPRRYSDAPTRGPVRSS